MGDGLGRIVLNVKDNMSFTRWCLVDYHTGYGNWILGSPAATAQATGAAATATEAIATATEAMD
jgi:hypothetical protein